MPLNASKDDITSSSFRIAIGAFYANTSTSHMTLSAPIVLATADTYDVSSDRNSSNEDAEDSEEEGDELTSDDLLDLMDI